VNRICTDMYEYKGFSNNEPIGDVTGAGAVRAGALREQNLHKIGTVQIQWLFEL
jgi:hypothetical protein